MTDAQLILLGAEGVAAVALLAAAALAGWRGWLALKRQELGLAATPDPRTAEAGARIELADLRERIRKLEAIAAGVEL